MSDREVKNMLSKIEEVAVTDEVQLDKIYSVGQSVTVIDGPFSSFLGNVSGVNNSRKTIKVDINIFGRKTPVEITSEQIVIE